MNPRDNNKLKDLYAWSLHAFITDRYDRALEYCDKGIKHCEDTFSGQGSDPKQAQFYSLKCDIFLAQNKQEEGIQALKIALNLLLSGPDKAKFHMKLADIYSHHREYYEQAKIHYNEVIHLTTDADDKALAYSKIGFILASEHDNNQAIQYYDKALTLFSNVKAFHKSKANSYFNRGETYRHFGNYLSAIENYKAAIKAYPDQEILEPVANSIAQNESILELIANDQSHDFYLQIEKYLKPYLAKKEYKGPGF